MSSARKLWSYQCEWDGCNKSFKGISTFEAHYRSHTGQRPYACDYGSCGEAFHDRGALNRHHRTHVDEQPFACNYESCVQMFPNSEALDQHSRTHIDQSPFTCKYNSCGQAFYDSGKLIEHHRTHKRRPLACEYDSCGRTFARRENLEAHMHMHTRERRFACSYEGCQKRFCDRESLSQHENSHISPLCRYEGSKQTSTEASQPHPHHHEGNTTSAEEVKPIRLRLTQPKRQNPSSLDDSRSPRKRIFLRLPIKNGLGAPSTSDPMEAHEPCSESSSLTKRSDEHIERRKVHGNGQPSSSNYSTSSSLKASSMPHTLTPSLRAHAPTSQPAVKSKSAEHNIDKPCTDEESNGHGTCVYTRVCGVYSMEKAIPNKANNGTGSYRCPRCETGFTRAGAVMRHFVGCITKYGNPDSLKWTDHPSLQRIVKYYARNGYRGQKHELLPAAAPGDVKRTSRESPKDDMLHSLVSKPLSSVVEGNVGSEESVYHQPGPDTLLKDVVQPIRKRQDALRRSNYNPETIASDVLVATGSHPTMDPLNAHVDILRKKFRSVNSESNMSTFRWDLVDPEQKFEQGSKKEVVQEPRQEREHDHEQNVEKEVEPEQSTAHIAGANKVTMKSEFNGPQWNYGLPFSLPSRSSIKQTISDNEVPFTVTLPTNTDFGKMSTIFSNVFGHDPSAKLMSSNEDLWAAVFTMLERRYHEQNFMTRAVFKGDSEDVIGWVACHEVDPLQTMLVDPPEHLDWTTAAHLLPPQISRFKPTQESAKEKAERSKRRMIGQGLALTIQTQAIEAQVYLVPIPYLVINALVVRGERQGRGVASALLKSITEIADRQQRPIWIQAPEDPAVAQGVLKAGLFRRAGFTCAGELNLDLDSYSGSREQDQGKGVSFGKYKWNYMLRWPQPVGQRPPQRRWNAFQASA